MPNRRPVPRKTSLLDRAESIMWQEEREKERLAKTGGSSLPGAQGDWNSLAVLSKDKGHWGEVSQEDAYRAALQACLFWEEHAIPSELEGMLRYLLGNEYYDLMLLRYEGRLVERG